MRVVFVIKEIGTGGGQTQDVALTIKTLSIIHNDWEFYVIAKYVYDTLPETLKDLHSRLIVEKKYYSLLLFNWRFTRLLSGFDFIYINGQFPYVVPAIKSKRPSLLVMYQQDSPLLYSSTLTGLQIFGSNALRKFIVRRMKNIVTVSEELADFYERKYGIRVKVIEDQINSEFYSAGYRKSLNDENAIKLLTVGAWDGPNGRKRQHIVVKYFSEAVKKEGRLRLTMVGLSEGNISFFKAMVKELNVNDYVTLKASMTEQELRDGYLSNDIFVTATSYEGFYRPIVEAFASGMPSLVFDSRTVVNDASMSASVNHVIKSGGGRLYTDPESFYSSILDILDHYGDLSRRAHDYSMKFKPENIGKKLVTLIDEILESEERRS